MKSVRNQKERNDITLDDRHGHKAMPIKPKGQPRKTNLVI